MKIERYDNQGEGGWALGLMVHNEGVIVGFGLCVYSVTLKAAAKENHG